MDRLTPRMLLGLCRLALGLGVVGLAILMLGPFQGLEQRFGLNDIAAHALAFYAASLGLFLAFPRSRRIDLAIVALSLGVMMEALQGLTGRSMSAADLGADLGGVVAAVAPGLIERLRHHVRTHPDLSFARIAQLDGRRRSARHRAAGAKQTVSAEARSPTV